MGVSLSDGNDEKQGFGITLVHLWQQFERWCWRALLIWRGGRQDDCVYLDGIEIRGRRLVALSFVSVRN